MSCRVVGAVVFGLAAVGVGGLTCAVAGAGAECGRVAGGVEADCGVAAAVGGGSASGADSYIVYGADDSGGGGASSSVE